MKVEKQGICMCLNNLNATIQTLPDNRKYFDFYGVRIIFDNGWSNERLNHLFTALQDVQELISNNVSPTDIFLTKECILSDGYALLPYTKWSRIKYIHSDDFEEKIIVKRRPTPLYLFNTNQMLFDFLLEYYVSNPMYSFNQILYHWKDEKNLDCILYSNNKIWRYDSVNRVVI